MFEWIRKHARPLTLTVAVALFSFGCGAVEEKDPDLVAAQKLLDGAVRMLDAGDYNSALLDLEKLVSPQSGDAASVKLAEALKKDVQSLDQARFAFVLAKTLNQIDEWIKLISQVVGLVSGLDLSPEAALAVALDPAAGTGIVAPTIGNILSALLDFFEEMHTALEPVKRNPKFQLRMQNFPVRFGDFTILKAPGEYDLGEVYLLDSMFQLAIGAMRGLNSIDYTISLDKQAIGYLFEKIGELQTDDISLLIEDILNLLGVVLYSQPRLLGVGDATELKESGNALRDSMDSFIKSLEFMRAETDEQSDDIIGYIRSAGNEQLEIHLQPQPIPGLPVDNEKLKNVRVDLSEDVFESLGRIRSSLNREAVRVSWAKDIVPLASLAVVTLLRTGAFNGLIFSALDLANLDEATMATVEQVLSGDILTTDFVTNIVLGFLPDVFEFDLGTYFNAEVPSGIRDVLPFFTLPVSEPAEYGESTTRPVYAEDGTTITGWEPYLPVTKWQDDLGSITLLLEYECKVGTVESRAVPEGFLCDDTVGEPIDLSHFIPEAGSPISAEAFINWWSAKGRLQNLQLLPGGELGMPNDGLANPIPYLALQDPAVGGLLYINLGNVPGNLIAEETVQTHYIGRGLGDVSGWVPADNFTLNALLAGVIGAIVDSLL
jgi:hypothetical protein